MALTLIEAGKLTQDLLLRGVIETIVSESSVLGYLPFMDITGNALTYNQEATLPTAAFYSVGDTWTEDTPTFAQRTARLAILGGDADVDNFLQQTYANPTDLAAAVVAAKAKAVGRRWSDTFFNGNIGVDPKSFDGLHTLIPAGQRLKAAGNNANGGALTLDDIDAFIDLVKPGKPDALFLSKRTRRKLKQLRRSGGNVLEVDLDSFGRRVEQFPRVWGRSEVGSGVSVRVLISETVSHPGWASAGIYFARCTMPMERAATNPVSYVFAEPLRQYRS